ncbi:NADP-dependent aldehyde dehydrogenase [Conyzicola lurida]|uniref:NADP-dependent aldehyde dehydrogenase n=1 Tax=Conyzicola lurida TaxID=1172621 RepID=A0A841AR81_9MICO|nr:aldehyde dehydrogenase (NADP(+)) [Conyzicola lurida]MBB5844808.1 NADP-dependent aldehyde dehydrogenase [Conyzicola lurida]
MTTRAELDTIVSTASLVAPIVASTTDIERALWLEAVADALDARVDDLVALANEESSLGVPRLTGEVARTTGQLRLFARVVREGSYLDATIDHADPGSTPPSPDLRRVMRPLGPVAVFAASNFPFAFSVAGGDTASALAVGCPVIVKAHPGHPRLSRLTASIVTEALRNADAPDGVFALVEGVETGIDLVNSPAIEAVGFTGSLHGGRALFDVASSRPKPIPFYGELGSLNPVLVTPAAVSADLAAGLAGSFTLGVGQFCTKPGVVFVPQGAGFEALLADAVGTPQPAPMLTPGLAATFAEGLERLQQRAETIVGAQQEPGSGTPVVLATTVADVLADPEALLVECFGPTTLLVRYESVDEALAAIAVIGGTLTATLHAAEGDDVADLADALARVSGRVLFGGWPTGVAVTWAQQHGGPWPSTTSPTHTSVGAAAVRRWVRPVAYQSAPSAVLPPALRDENPLGIPQRVDGVLTLP